MGDALYRGGKMMAVIVVLVVIFIGIAGFLVALERRIRKIERKEE